MSRRSPRLALVSGSSSSRPDFWQRRCLEKYFAHLAYEELAREARLSASQVLDYLTLIGAKRLSAKASTEPAAQLPTCWTPSRVRQHLITPRTRTLDRKGLWLVVAMFLVSAAVYIATAARTVTGEDAGEIMVAGYGLKNPHPLPAGASSRWK